MSLAPLDLHLHTTASADAHHTPRELFAMARELGLRCIAFADHNVIDAVPEGIRLARETGIEFITGVELNTEIDGRELHLLGYGFDPDSPAVQAWFAEIAAMLRRQAARKAARLNELGLAVTLDAVLAQSRGRDPAGSSFLDAMAAIPGNRAHPLVAPYLEGPKAADPYVNFYFEVMARGKPADVGDESLPAREAIARLRSLEAVPVAGHPRDLPESDLRKLIDAGLLGVEAICSYHDAATAARWIETADRFGLFHTAGSDFHGVRTKATVKMGDLPGADWRIVERLRAAIANLAPA